ncbi:type II toxin-antitoxin system YoeB family toxin [Chryseobacterium koreense]|uniref:type II toxin-antitoxin system YoeB family toxin n=1 Tax=Chryseobacterium koreense TaxID=232216 RepID=UPI0034E966F5
MNILPKQKKDIDKLKKAGDKAVLIKIDKLLDELREHPLTGTGKPEKLRHYQTPT